MTQLNNYSLETNLLNIEIRQFVPLLNDKQVNGKQARQDLIRDTRSK